MMHACMWLSGSCVFSLQKYSLHFAERVAFVEQEMFRFGGAIDTADGAGLMIVGDELFENDG